MLDSASEVELESDSSSIEGSKDALATNEQLSRRVDSLQQENRVLKTEVETLKLKIKGLNETIQQLRRNSVNIQARAEQEEEFISNTLLKKITELKKEKESLALNYEQEEECLTNELNRKFTQLRQEKVALERTLAREQEDQVSKLKSRIEKLETDMNNKQECLDRLRREKIELENALEQEQEALVNRLWKKMETLETEKKTLQEKLESLGAMLSASSSNQSIASVSHPTSTDGSLPSAPVISTGAISNSRPTSSGPGSLRAQSRPSVTTHSLSPPHTSTEASTRPLIPHSLLLNTVALSSSDARSQLNQSASIPTDSAVPKTSPSGPHPIPPQSPMDVDHSDHPQSERTSPLRPDRISQPHKLFITDSKQFEAEEPKRNQLLKGSVADWDANTTAAYVNRLREEVRHLRQLLEKYEAETATKMVMYESEERSAIEENRRLRKLLQIEKERREALSRHLSESESSLEMEDERHFNEACRNPRLRTTSDSAFHPPTHLTNVSMIYGPGHAYAAAVAAGFCTSQPSSASSRICHECGQRLLPLWEESSAPVTGSPSVRSPPTSLHTTNLPRPPHGPCCSPGKSCGHHHVSLPNSPATPTTSPGSLSAAFAKPSSMRAPVSTSDRNSFPMDSRDGFFEKIPSPYCSSEQLFISGDFANNDDAADADDDDDARCATPPPKMRLFTPEIAWHETLPIYSCDLQPQTSSPSKWCTPFADLTEVTVTQGTSASPPPGRWTRLATAGGDTVVRLWRVQLDWTMQSSVASLSLTNGAPTKSTAKKRSESHAHLSEHLTYLASLKRHEKPVNVVRWSPSGLYLASAGDDLFIVLWCNQTEQPPVERTEAMGTCKDDDNDDEAAVALETWVPCRSLRRHLEDIYDLCWSPDSQSLISGSVDHSVIVWQLDLVPSARAPSPTEGPVDKSIPQKTDATQPLPPTPSTGSGNTKCLILRDHKHYVQGVTWDPLGFYIASLSGDRACRIYRAGSKNCLAHVSKCGKQRLFQDDSWKSFFRRLTFSPDGLLLACPSGNLEDAAFASTMSSLDACVEPEAQPIPVVAPQHAAHVFLRSNFTRPAVSFPTGNRPVVTVRFCPQPFQLRITGSVTDESSSTRKLFDLPYRWLFCLVLEDGILFCDTQQSSPFAQVSQMHYQALNDATWSDDGHTLVTCSTDGYCSVIRFTHGELGIPYRGPIGPVPKEAKDLCDKTPSVLDDPSTKGQLYGDLDKSHHESSPQKDPDVPQVTSKTTTEDAVNNEIHSKKRRVTLKTLSTTINDSVKTTTAAQPDKTTSHEPVESKSHEPALRKRRVSFVTLTSDTTAQSASSVQLVDTGGSPSKESQE